MTIRYGRETFSESFYAAQALLESHYREISTYQDIPLDFDVSAYQAAEAADRLRIYTARYAGAMHFGDGMTHVENRMIGYAAFIVAPNAKSKGSLQADCEAAYVEPSFRRGRIGLRLLSFADDQLRADGVQVVRHHVKLKHPALGRLLQSGLGYTPDETIFTRRLDL